MLKNILELIFRLGIAFTVGLSTSFVTTKLSRQLKYFDSMLTLFKGLIFAVCWILAFGNFIDFVLNPKKWALGFPIAMAIFINLLIWLFVELLFMLVKMINKITPNE